MSASKDQYARIRDIIEYASHVLRMTNGLDFETFTDNFTVQFAVIHCIEIMGEVARHVPPEVQARCPEVEWRLMTDMRNVLAHGYSGVDLTIVWAAVENRIPPTRERLMRFLETEQAAQDTAADD